MSSVTRPATRRHAPPTVALHWVTALVIAIAFALGWWFSVLDGGSLKDALRFVHSQAGLLVLALVLLRLGNRLHAPALPSEPGLVAWQLRLATGSHALLYLLMFVQPLLGWLLLCTRGRPPTLLGALPLRLPIAVDPDLADRLADLHLAGAWVLSALIGLHVAAALWHGLVRRDGVLASMWPPSRRHVLVLPQPSEPPR